MKIIAPYIWFADKDFIIFCNSFSICKLRDFISVPKAILRFLDKFQTLMPKKDCMDYIVCKMLRKRVNLAWRWTWIEIKNSCKICTNFKTIYGQIRVFIDSSFVNQQCGLEYILHDLDLYNLDGSMNHIMNFSQFPLRELTLAILIICNFIPPVKSSFEIYHVCSNSIHDSSQFLDVCPIQ